MIFSSTVIRSFSKIHLKFYCFSVSKSFIVTAAHCIETARIKDIIVYLGEHDTQNSGAIMEPLPSEKHYVIRKFIHPRFQFRVTQPDRFDLALLQLAIPTTFT